MTSRLQHALDRHAQLFDTVERSPLTHEQRIAAVTVARRQLLIAAAGSGKTSTMVGKVACALAGGRCKPEQILVLAFNRKAAAELDERLRKSLAGILRPGESIQARTLHSLGLDIVSRVQGRRPVVHDGDGGLLDRVLARLLNHDVDFAEQWLLFRVFHHSTLRHPDQFPVRRQWNAFVRRHGQRRKRRYGFVTLRGDLVDTQFEQAVANWCHFHNIHYVYGPIKGGRWNLPGARRPLAGKRGFWLGAYGRHIVCVRTCHEAAPTRRKPAGSAGCPDIHLNLQDFRDGKTFALLRRHLCPDRKVPPPGRIGRLLAGLGYRLTPGQRELLLRFIRLARLSGMAPETLRQRAVQIQDSDQANLHAPMLARLLDAWEQALRDWGGIDFEGMLHMAANYLEQNRHRHPWTLILVDEFQDTSQAGVRLLQALLGQNPGCRLFAVGDDWQSIYRFAGAVPDVLSGFQRYFGPAETSFLTATFRFNQVVADMAGTFVQANPAQLRKQVRARPADSTPSVVLAWYATTAHMYSLCEECLADAVRNPPAALASCLDGAGARSLAASCPGAAAKRVSVYILGRYRHQRPAALHQWQRRFPQLDIQFQTVHSAKGLEADIVIVTGLSAGRYGFPSVVPDDPLLSLVMPDAEPHPHAEERRLFYVAITRCRYRVYLLAHMQEPSCFVTELLENPAGQYGML